jgi:hypothetical protein
MHTVSFKGAKPCILNSPLVRRVMTNSAISSPGCSLYSTACTGQPVQHSLYRTACTAQPVQDSLYNIACTAQPVQHSLTSQPVQHSLYSTASTGHKQILHQPVQPGVTDSVTVLQTRTDRHQNSFCDCIL